MIIPTFNERENIRIVLEAVLSSPIRCHVVVVDDRSPDKTAQAVEQMIASGYQDRLFLIRREHKKGLGAAYLDGFRFALEKKYNYIFQMDADLSHNPKDLEALSRSSRTLELVVGSRYVQGINVINWPLSRILLSVMASKFVRLLTGIPVKDTTSGFCCFRREVLLSIPLKSLHLTGYAFQIELKYLAWIHGFSIGEIPIIFTNRVRGKSKMSSSIMLDALLVVLRLGVLGIFQKKKTAPGSVKADHPDRVNGTNATGGQVDTEGHEEDK